tara:strand:+ start:2023 stop:2223 length:201 start_codon:yes stop_codon:yes gene_type:complete
MIKTAKDMKKLLIAYNKSVRKLVYKAVSKMKKADMLALIEKDFNIIEKKNGKHQYKHKSGRFTKIY